MLSPAGTKRLDADRTRARLEPLTAEAETVRRYAAQGDRQSNCSPNPHPFVVLILNAHARPTTAAGAMGSRQDARGV